MEKRNRYTAEFKTKVVLEVFKEAQGYPFLKTGLMRQPVR